MDEDFGNRTWSDQELGLKNSTSGGTITFLSYHSLKGVREAVFNPLLQVCSFNFHSLHALKLM